MKQILFYIGLVLFVASCSNKSNEDESGTSSNDSLKESKIPEILPLSDSIISTPYYIINLSATENQDSAIEMVKNYRKEFENVNYLWIPDFESLSGKELYVVFIGPYSDIEPCVHSLMDYKETNKDAYAVLVSHEKQRRVIYSPFDIRVNDKRVKQIFTYAEPAASEEYFEGGGEDWGWFVGDVTSYFSDNHPEVEFFSVYNDILRDKDIKMLEKELDLGDSFGYILVNGNEKEFLVHDMPNSIISSACEFFSLVMNEVD
ncbi:MAG: SPOR domain-containing protein [Bacteroidales bacterium]|nr:SPOR domain-containing protein [Bacteroidales bacterium]